MTLRTLGTLTLAGALMLPAGMAWSSDLEPLVPGGYFAEALPLNAQSSNNGDTASGFGFITANWSDPGLSQAAPSFDLSLDRQLLSGSRSYVPRYGVSAHGSYGDPGIAVFTPRFAGLQGAVGYRPESLGTDQETQIGVNWMFDLSPDSRITAASSYELDRGGFDIGAGFAQGPWELQLTYGTNEGETERSEIESLAFSAGYTLGPGISLTGILGAAGASGSAQDNDRVDDLANDDFWVVTGFKIRF